MNPMPIDSTVRASIWGNGQAKSGLVRSLAWLILLTSLSSSVLTSVLTIVVFQPRPSLALPPPEDQPEEVLRTEVILEARSPRDGSPITAAEYAELQAELEAENQQVGTVAPEVRRVIFLLRVRKVLRTILPFLP